MRALFFILFLIAQSTHAKLELRYSSEISPMESARIEGDLHFLSGFHFDDQDGELKKQFKLENSRPEAIEQWLSKRAQYILSSREKIDSQDIEVSEYPISYPNSELPFFVEPKKLSEEIKVQFSMTAVMQNLSGLLYLHGKALKRAVALRIEGLGQILVNSPRVGIFVAGEKFFEAFDPRLPPEAVEESGHRLSRISSLIHEARHSDSNRKTLSFPHVFCPKGHPFRGAPVCDSAKNGSYGLEAAFLRSALASCVNCGDVDKAFLNMLYLDAKSRVVGQEIWSEDAEFVAEHEAD